MTRRPCTIELVEFLPCVCVNSEFARCLCIKYTTVNKVYQCILSADCCSRDGKECITNCITTAGLSCTRVFTLGLKN